MNGEVFQVFFLTGKFVTRKVVYTLAVTTKSPESDLLTGLSELSESYGLPLKSGCLLRGYYYVSTCHVIFGNPGNHSDCRLGISDRFWLAIFFTCPGGPGQTRRQYETENAKGLYRLARAASQEGQRRSQETLGVVRS